MGLTTRRLLFARRRRRYARLVSSARSSQRNSVFFTFVLASLIGFAVFASAAALTLIGMGIGAAYTYRQVTKNLPSVATIGNEHLAESSIIYDRHGTELYQIVDPELGVRTSVPLSDVSPYLIWATVSVENPTFFTDPGVDIASIARAAFQDFAAGRTLSGASTITQQLIKNTILGSQMTILRKMREAVLAYRLTKELPKSRILELYLNSIFYGNNRYGVEAASELYFGKHAKDLDLAQASLLAGLPQSPSYYDPYTNFPVAKRRQHEVLQAMVRQQLITQQQANQAFAENLHLVPLSAQKVILRAPHFVFYVINRLVQQYGYDEVYRGGLRITTTLDYPLQKAAQQIVHDQIGKISAAHHATDGALVAIDPRNGQILAMVGSADYNNRAIHGEVNVALAPRQPGSTVKVFTYAAAFERGYSPASVVVDAKTNFPTSRAMIDGVYQPPEGIPLNELGYIPCNYDNQVRGCPPQYFHGPVTMREALGNSLNVPAVKTLEYAGIGNMISLARRMGITTWNKPVQDYGLSITLGGSEVTLLDLTSAYGVFADGGIRYPPVPWLDIHDIYGHVFYHSDPLHPHVGKQVISPQVAYLITSVLSDDSARALEFGTHSGLVLSREAAAKTGTTDSFRDNWTVGYTPNLVTGVWVGNADDSPMRNVIGITGAGPIWHDFMETALRTLPVMNFKPPPGLVEERVSDLTGLLPNSSGTRRIIYTLEPGTHFYFSNYVNIGEPSHVDWFIQGTEPRIHTYRLGTYTALWSTGQEAINCPPYMTDVRVFGPQPPPPGLYNCATDQVIPTAGFQYTNGWDNPIIALPSPTPHPSPRPHPSPNVKQTPQATPAPASRAIPKATATAKKL